MASNNRRPDRVAEAIRVEVATFLSQDVKDPRIVGLVRAQPEWCTPRSGVPSAQVSRPSRKPQAAAPSIAIIGTMPGIAGARTPGRDGTMGPVAPG